MHLQQTKARSRKSGGPQYYFHDLTDPVKEYLRKRGACPVVLQTPYGIAETNFTAVGKDHKLGADGKAVPGRVGHDRIQQAAGEASIGEAIRYWYGLKAGNDFERIDVDVSFHKQGHFILIPTAVKMRQAGRVKHLEGEHAPLSFHRDYQSRLWRDHIDVARKQSQDDVAWAALLINRVVADHGAADAAHIHEADLLRVSGALAVLGLDLGAYQVKGYDCPKSVFQFSSLPMYTCPVEIKKHSRGFNYQVAKYSPLPRAVVLCMTHDMKGSPAHVDFVELPALAEYLGV